MGTFSERLADHDAGLRGHPGDGPIELAILAESRRARH